MQMINNLKRWNGPEGPQGAGRSGACRTPSCGQRAIRLSHTFSRDDDGVSAAASASRVAINARKRSAVKSVASIADSAARALSSFTSQC